MWGVEYGENYESACFVQNMYVQIKENLSRATHGVVKVPTFVRAVNGTHKKNSENWKVNFPELSPACP